MTVDGGDTGPSRINTIRVGDKMIITPAGAQEQEYTWPTVEDGEEWW